MKLSHDIFLKFSLGPLEVIEFWDFFPLSLPTDGSTRASSKSFRANCSSYFSAFIVALKWQLPQDCQESGLSKKPWFCPMLMPMKTSLCSKDKDSSHEISIFQFHSGISFLSRFNLIFWQMLTQLLTVYDCIGLQKPCI